jgi:hypothetical protein
MSPVYLYGNYDRPETWSVSDSEPSDDTFRIKFDNYEVCRKWVMKELVNKRRTLGNAMDNWLIRNIKFK